MTIGGAFAALFEFIRTSWHIVIGSMLVTVLIAAGAIFALFGSDFTGLNSQDPGVVMAVFGGLMLAMVVAGVFYFAGSFLSWRHALTGGSEPVLSNLGWALGASAMSLLAMIAITIILYVVLAVVMLLVFAVLGLGGGLAGGLASPDAGLAGAGVGIIIGIVLLYVVMIVGFYWVYGRLMAAGPVMAALRTVNPITGLTESWRLTRPSQWVIVGFQLLIALMSFVLSMLAGLVMGAAAAGFAAGFDSGGDPGTIAGLISLAIALLVYVPILVIAVAMPMAVYRQVSEGDMQSGEIFA